MSTNSQSLITVTSKLSGAVASCRFVTFAGLQAGAGEKCLGVTIQGGAIGDAVSVAILGTGSIQAGGVFAKGDPLVSDALGQAVKAVSGGINAGTALEASTAAGQTVEILIDSGSTKNNVSATTDVTGKITNLTAAGRDAIADLALGSGGVSSSALAKSQIKVAWLGNSVIANASAMIGHLKKISGGLLVTVKNGGIPGQGSLGMLQDIATNLDTTADVVIYMEGSNDAYSNLGVGVHYSQMKAVGDYCAALGKQLIVLASPPRDLSGTSMHKYTQKYAVTDWMVAYDLGATYCDPWRDARAMDGSWIAGYTTSNDYTHPAFNDIYYAAAVRLWDAIKNSVVGQLPVIEPTSNDENAGYSSVADLGAGLTKGNVLFQTGTAGWGLKDATLTTVVDANVVLSTASAAPFRGNEMIMDFTAGISATRNLKRVFLANTSTYKPAVGNDMFAAAVVRATGLSNARVRVYNYAPNGGWADKLLMDTRRFSFEREYINSGIFTATGSNPQECSIVVEITQINTGAPAYGVVAISNCDIYNLSKLRTSTYGV